MGRGEDGPDFGPNEGTYEELVRRLGWTSRGEGEGEGAEESSSGTLRECLERGYGNLSKAPRVEESPEEPCGWCQSEEVTRCILYALPYKYRDAHLMWGDLWYICEKCWEESQNE